MIYYALMTAPQREADVKAVLDKSGYRVLMPVEQVWRRVSPFSKRRKLVAYPLFPRYLIVGYAGGMPWLHLAGVRHVTGVVGFDGTPAKISGKDMCTILSMTVAPRAVLNPHRALRAGDLAEITSGVFVGRIVKIEGLTGRKARIFLDLFGTLKEVEIPVEALEAA